ncbi:phage tail tip lysozyme [Kribbella sp. NPDC056951]|uniref:phage tail tip lysozyme n=1 Tax=Kribbella sp. NPDC056951 TaxID=3345978 RepID=UPI003632BB3B
MDNKGPLILGGVLTVFFLPLIIAIALIIGSLMSLPDAEASGCGGPSGGEVKPFSWPTDEKEIDEEWSDDHKGVDFDVDEKSPVYAVDSGEVIKNADNEIWIRHEKAVEFHYKFFHDMPVKVGDKVARGQQIGTSGSGDEEEGASGEHLHFELWVDEKGDGKLVNTDPKEESFGDTPPPAGGGGCGCGSGPLIGTDNQQKAFNFLVSNGYSKEQAAGAVGNMVVESYGVRPLQLQDTKEGAETTAQQAEGSSAGWGIVQWTPASKIISASRRDGVPYETIGTLEHQLNFLLKQLQTNEKPASDQLKRTTTPEDAAYAFGHYYERFAGHEGDPNSQNYRERKTAARLVFTTFSGASPGANPGATPATACAQGSGDIAAVAKNLAWPNQRPEYNHQGSNAADAKVAKPEFVQAMKDFNDPNGDRAYTDCGRFVATVMHMSGADKSFPKVSTGDQNTYMRSSGKYDFWHGEPPGGMKPGDILNGPGHTYLYTGPWGEEGKGYNSASGSLGDHVPYATYLYKVGTQFTVFRLKVAPAGPDKKS